LNDHSNANSAATVGFCFPGDNVGGREFGREESHARLTHDGRVERSLIVGVVVARLDEKRIAELTGDIPQNVNFAVKDSVTRSFLEANGSSIRCVPQASN
jgi:hypothetical protein